MLLIIEKNRNCLIPIKCLKKSQIILNIVSCMKNDKINIWLEFKISTVIGF